ncbi:MAG: hydroxymethylglutaryl-CoA reductase, degradative [Chloroflexi bacterium]|nr:hydroxymethylglutaryl-CoA reductase, degradative [Chloroflexota bacterium]
MLDGKLAMTRIPEFYKLHGEARLRELQARVGLTDEEIELLRAGGGLSLQRGEQMSENVVGLFSLPLGIAVNFLIDGRDVLIPMAIEEPSVVAAASHAAKLAREGGGFHTQATPPVMIGQIQIIELGDIQTAERAIRRAKAQLLEEANRLHPGIAARGGGAVDLQVRRLEHPTTGRMLVLHLLYDVRDAMGANAVNTIVEHLAPLVEQLTGGRAVLRILTNLADRRLARATAAIPARALATEGLQGHEVAQRILEAQALAEVDPYRAATHNKGILNGVDAVALATGNDWRAIEAGAHAYAARTGHYLPLSSWVMNGEENLVGELEMPLAVGIVGGATRAHPVAQICLKILGVSSAQELARILAAVGLAQNLAALRALTTEGIQRGHMALHARQMALSAGAPSELAEAIAERMVVEENIRVERAKELLAELMELKSTAEIQGP